MAALASSPSSLRSSPEQIGTTLVLPCRRRGSMQFAHHRHNHHHLLHLLLLLHSNRRSTAGCCRIRNRRKNGSSSSSSPLLASASASSSSPSSSSAAALEASSSSQPVSDVVWPASGAFVAMAAMSYLDKLIEPMGLTFTIAPFGAVCAVLFAAPNTPAAKKYNMFVAHIGYAALGVGAMGLFGPGWLARATSLSASLAFMHFTRAFHPPAAGLPLLFIDAPKFQKLNWWYIIFPSAIGCALLCLLQEAVEYLKRTYRF